MAGNHLEELVAEWYQHEGYFVRRNVQVGPREKGGYACELDIVAFHPGKEKLVHVEPSLDSDGWEKREARYRKKFEAGKRYIPSLFEGLTLPPKPEQIALFVYGGGGRTELAGGRVMFIREFMRLILQTIRKTRVGNRERRVDNAAIPEEYPLLRTLQFAAQYWPLSPAGPITDEGYSKEQVEKMLPEAEEAEEKHPPLAAPRKVLEKLQKVEKVKKAKDDSSSKDQ